METILVAKYYKHGRYLIEQTALALPAPTGSEVSDEYVLGAAKKIDYLALIRHDADKDYFCRKQVGMGDYTSVFLVEGQSRGRPFAMKQSVESDKSGTKK